jgi:hypothetical protein
VAAFHFDTPTGVRETAASGAYAQLAAQVFDHFAFVVNGGDLDLDEVLSVALYLSAGGVQLESGLGDNFAAVYIDEMSSQSVPGGEVRFQDLQTPTPRGLRIGDAGENASHVLQWTVCVGSFLRIVKRVCCYDSPAGGIEKYVRLTLLGGHFFS